MAAFTPTGVIFIAKGLNQYLGGLTKANKKQQFLGTSAAVLAVGLGNLAVKGFKAVIDEGQAFTKGMSNVAALTGATRKEFTALENVAKTLGKTTKFTALEASEGMAFLAQAGFETNEIIQTLPGTLNLAAAANVGLGKSADIVSNILTGFGATVQDTGKFVDVLTNTFTTSNTDLLQLGQAMKNVAPVAASLGISVEETAAAIGKMGDAGIQGGRAGTQLKNALLNLTAPTAQQAELMEKLGIEIFDTSGEMFSLPQIIGNVNKGLEGLSEQQTIAAVKTLAGKRAIAGFQVLLNQGQPALEAYTQSLEQTGTAAEIAATQLDNLAGDVTLFQSALSGLEITAFETMEENLRVSTQSMTGLIGEVDKAVVGFGKLGEAVSVIVGAFSGSTEKVNLLTVAIHGGQTAWKLYGRIAESVIDPLAQLALVVVKLTVGEEELARRLTLAGGGFKGASQTASGLGKQFGALTQQTEKTVGVTEELTEAVGKVVIPTKILIAAQGQVNEALRLTQQEAAPVVSLYDSLTLSARDLAEAQAEVASASQAAALATAFAQEPPSQAALFEITPEQRTAQAEAIFAQTQIDLDIDTSGISSAITDSLQQIKSAVSQVSGLTFNEILPPGETFRVDEWVRRLAAVVDDGSNQFAQQAVTAFAGEKFIQPLADAIATGDPQAISDAAAAIINGPDLFELMDIEGAANQAEGLIAEQNLGQRIDDAIVAILAEREGIPDTGIGGETILNAIGLGEGADVTTPITDAVAGLDIPSAIAEGLVVEEGESPLLALLGLEGADVTTPITDAVSELDIPGAIAEGLVVEEGESPLLALLGLGEEGTLISAIANFIDTTLPGLGEAFLALSEGATEQFGNVIMATTTEDMALLKIADTTLPALQTQAENATSAMVSGFDAATKALEKTFEAIGKVIEALEKLKAKFDPVIKKAQSLRDILAEAAKFARKISFPGSGGGTELGQGIGFRQGVGFQGGLGLGATVPGTGNRDTFGPVFLTPGEEVLVAPKSTSIDEIIAGRLGPQQITVNMSVTINNQADFEITRDQVARLIPELIAGDL